MDFTREQKEAIFTRGKDILVSAGAGAGKTRVLVTRISEMILDETDPISADHMLVLTFTNAAAREMKERMKEELEERLLLDPSNDRLREQIRVIKHADISTVHSFCNRLIRTHFNELGIDPSFRIGEEGELKILKGQVMEELLEDSYEKAEDSFLSMVEAYAPGRADSSIEEMVNGIYEFSTGFPDARKWFEDARQAYEDMMTEEGMEQSILAREIMEHARREIRVMTQLISQGESYFDESKEPVKFYDYLQADVDIVRSLEEAETFSQIFACLRQVSFQRMPTASKAEKQWPYLEAFKGTHNRIKAMIKDMTENLFPKSLAEIRMEHKAMYEIFQELISLGIAFGERYKQKKREKNLYDFNDLEHMAMELLVDSYDEEGRPIPTSIAKEIAGRYQAIFVDEYQDTSLMQETLIQCIKEAGESHIFVVGDVKQSIYRFRQARPDLFLKRYYDYEQGNGCKIELRDNFRSSPDVLEFCNQFFRRWMSEEFGGIDYDETVCLRAGINGPMYDQHETQEALILVKDTEDSEEEAMEPILAEAMMIGEKIKTLHQEGYAYEDMVILLRSMKNSSEIIAEYLESQRIPVICESHTGYFRTREIQVILNYLSVIDNVYLDIPMASVMLSGIGGFSATDLAKMKILIDAKMRKHLSIYELMKLYLEEGDDILCKEKIQCFLAMLQDFRQKRQEMLLHELIWEIYQKTGFYEQVLSMPHGEKRRENLMMLLKKAEEYEKTMLKGLFYFVRYMEQLQTYEVEIGGASVVDSVEKAVRIMTVHKSKGLEFPVVFVSTLSKGFNRTDLNHSVLYHPELGIGMEKIDLQERTKETSILKQIIKERIHKEMTEEELRILYVAMTRAQRKVILTASVTEKRLQEVIKDADLQIPAEHAKCFMDWILPVLYQGEEWKDTTFYNIAELLEKVEEASQEDSFSINEIASHPKWKEADAQAVKNAFSRSYPYEESVEWKRKYSVSELKKISMQKLPDEEIPVWEVTFDEEEIPKPAFLTEEEEKISATDFGTMIHKIMELLPYGKIETGKDLFDALNELWKRYPQVRESTKKKTYKAVEKFLFSENGKILAQAESAKRLYKEYPFTIGLDASIVYPETKGGETIVLQGVIDLFAETEEGLWLLDYKTDRIKEGEEGILLDRYKTQMLYYKLALEQMLEKKVVKTSIYSFALQKYIDILW